MGAEQIRRWESGALAHAVSDPFGQGPLPWLRGSENYFDDTGQMVPWYADETLARGGGGGPRTADDVHGQIKGFVSSGAVAPGEAIDFHITVDPPQQFSVDIYRIGHYGGDGAAKITTSPRLSGIVQPAPLTADRTVSCHHWWQSWRLQIPSYWSIGAYVAVLTTVGGYRSHIPFTVRDSHPADLLLVLPDVTWQAYNLYPEDGRTGASLYHAWDEEGRLLGEEEAAVTVSFDRPYAGAGLPLHVGHAYDFIRWAERYGYDLAYAETRDLHAGRVDPSRYRGLVFPGHDEYWSAPMRRTAELARDQGTSLVFLSANTMYWQVELGPSPSGAPDRLLTCRKRRGPGRPALWREVDRPEQQLLGIQYAGRVPEPHPWSCGTRTTGCGRPPARARATSSRAWSRARPTATSRAPRSPSTRAASCSPTRPTGTARGRSGTRRRASTGPRRAPGSSPPAPSPGRRRWTGPGTWTRASSGPPRTCSTGSARGTERGVTGPGGRIRPDVRENRTRSWINLRGGTVSGFVEKPEPVQVPGLTHLHTGKVRDLYRNEAGELVMVASDRMSAYDWVLPTEIPDKGRVLTKLSLWWFDRLADLVPNHVLSTELPAGAPADWEGRTLICKSLDMVPVECVARGYLTGSGLVEYDESRTVCGLALPEGLTDGSELPAPIFTPATKAAVGDHDENVSYEEVARQVGAETAAVLRRTTLDVYGRARDIARERGVILADTKFEFGFEGETLVLADEVLTPDSSRFWPADEWQPGRTQPSYDKQFVRNWLTSPASGWDRKSEQPPPALPQEVVDATRAKYIEAYERLTGTTW